MVKFVLCVVFLVSDVLSSNMFVGPGVLRFDALCLDVFILSLVFFICFVSVVCVVYWIFVVV